jgi:hypothetical protein
MDKNEKVWRKNAEIWRRLIANDLNAVVAAIEAQLMGQHQAAARPRRPRRPEARQRGAQRPDTGEQGLRSDAGK